MSKKKPRSSQTKKTPSKQKQSKKQSSKQKRSRRFKLVLCFIGLLTGISLIGGFELFLHLIDAAKPDALFLTLTEDTEEKDRKLLCNNQLFPFRFFFRRFEGKFAGVGETNLQVFWSPKPKDTLRILFIGASTVQGYPHPRNLNAASFIRIYMKDLLPEKQVEVINLGTTALASFAVSKVLEEASELDPDVVVAYLGHNEFFGAYGVASLMKAWISPFGCRLHYNLKQMRIARLFNSLKGKNEKVDVTKKDLMEIMAATEFLPPEDSRRETAYLNLKINLKAMAKTTAGWDVPFVVCTLVSNEKDLAPVRTYLPDLKPQEKFLYKQLLEKQTSTSLNKAEKIFPDSASLWYLRGRLFFTEGKFDEARAAFNKAIDLDAMPWRACSKANKIITNLASEPNVFLSDVEAEFRKYASHQIFGEQLFLDHIHPNTQGQALLARAIFSTLEKALPELKLNSNKLKPLNYYTRLLGDCPAVQFHLLTAMATIFSKEPLSRNNRKTALQYNQKAKRLYKEMHPAYRKSYIIWKTLPKGMMSRPLVMVCAEEFLQLVGNVKPDLPESERLFHASIYGTPSYTPLRLEAVERFLAVKERSGTKLSQQDKTLAVNALQMAREILNTDLRDKEDVKKLIDKLNAHQ